MQSHRVHYLLATFSLLLGLSACAPKTSQETQETAQPAAEASAAVSASTPASPQTFAWQVPQQMPADEKGEQIKWGEALISQTSKHLGPDMADPSKRIAGNHMACKNCHLQAGKQANTMGFVGVAARFPTYRGRENREVTLEERINGCFERSLNGRPLPTDSPEMQAIVAYMQWLSQDVPKGAKVSGQGLPEIQLLQRAASPEKGKGVYQQKCALCHQPTGAGLRLNPQQPADGYVYPPLWGPDSFNNGAGMGRVITAARYIKANMPFGSPNLTDEEAFDVAAFINSMARPEKARLEQDYPDRSKKPVDAPYGPWPGNFPAEQHKYGPFQPMQIKAPVP